MDVMDVLRINLHVAHDAFMGTVSDLTQEMIDWLPPGIAHPIGERYLHCVVAEDWLVHGISKGGAPLFTSTWKVFDNFNLGASSLEARAMKVDLNQVAEYARAVFPASEEYLNSLPASEAERIYDMSAVGYGNVPAPAWWSTFVIGHIHDIMGEISALKGCQGAKGYPY